jgi:hypothetical protein
MQNWFVCDLEHRRTRPTKKTTWGYTVRCAQQRVSEFDTAELACAMKKRQ